MRQCDVAIVGAGIAGSSLATSLARAGLDVVVLEASNEYVDRVRGESLVPWGVAEARQLGVEQVLLDAGANRGPQWLHYDPSLDAPLPIPVGIFVADVPGSLNLRHPVACAALADAAVAAGVELHRGVEAVTVAPGPTPSLTWQGGELEARLVVGADGRNSTIRRQLGVELEREPEIHMIAGLILEADDLPDDHDFLASEGDLFMAAFVQSGGAIRVYLCAGLTQRHRFSGPGGLDEFRRSVSFDCLPFGTSLGAGTPTGPLATYPGDDSWTAEPFAPGVVLIGDAAGWSNPIVGQGLSIAMRDARIARDQILGGDLDFRGYGSDRVSRMRRHWYLATLLGAAMAEDVGDRPARRARYFDLLRDDPELLPIMSSNFAGPETMPDSALDGRLLAALRAAG